MREGEPSAEYGRRDPDDLIRRAGIRGDPDRDQHFLVDDRVLDRLPGYATEAEFDLGNVLEIGPGPGSLTDRLLAVAERVTVIERDADLADFLEREFGDAVAAGRLTVIPGDATTVEYPEFTACISNLPYGVSSELLFRLLPENRPTLVMLQREFAERMAAEPGSDAYGRLSVTAGHFADVEIVEVVPATAFDPQPAVESAVVRTTPREPAYAVPDEDAFMRVVTGIFTQRRKTLRNAIRNTTHITGIADPAAVIETLGEELCRRRPGTLDPATYARITRVASTNGGFTDV